MRVTIAAIIVLTMFLLVVACDAQMVEGYQSVGGEFGQAWLSNLKAQNQPAAEENGTGNLWDWGEAPKGSQVINGKLVSDPHYLTPWYNLSSNWLSDIYVDPNTGMPINAYFNPVTGKLVYVYLSPATGSQYYSSIPSDELDASYER